MSFVAEEQVITVEDLMQAAYGPTASGVPALLTDGGFSSLKSKGKADAPASTSATNYYNPVYGSKAFRSVNDMVNAWGALPKGPFQRTGTRVISANGGAAADGGHTEGASLNDAIIPTVQKYSGLPKEVLHMYQTTTKQQFLFDNTDDDTALGMQDLRAATMRKHMTALTQQILVDNQTAASTNFESLDRIISSNAEVVASTLTANSCDIWGLNRDATGFSDAYVDSGASGVDRVWEDALLRTMLANLNEAGAATTFFLTGPTTMQDVVGVYNTQVRYEGGLAETMVQTGVNGINTEKGLNAGKRIAMLYGIPVIVDQNVATDTKDRFYAVDSSVDPEAGDPRLYIKIAIPTLNFETGPQLDKDLFKSNKLANKGAFMTSGEIWCNDFAKQGKIRDLK